MKRILYFVVCVMLVVGMASAQQAVRSQAQPYCDGMFAEKSLNITAMLKAGVPLPKVAGVSRVLEPASVISDAADWLDLQQASSGGFPWTVGGAIEPNVQGPSGRGMLAAYNATATASYLTSATDNGNYLVPTYPRTYTDGDPRFATHDPLFLEELSTLLP